VFTKCISHPENCANIWGDSASYFKKLNLAKTQNLTTDEGTCSMPNFQLPRHTHEEQEVGEQVLEGDVHKLDS
jgi:hypothetical protein